MANTPFKLKSGNTTPFKQMGSSPAKQMPKNFNIQDKKLNKYKHAKKWDLLKKYYKTHAKSLSEKATQVLKKGGKKTASRATASRALPVIGEALMTYDVLKEGVKRVAEGVKTDEPKTKLTGEHIKDTWKRAPKKKYAK